MYVSLMAPRVAISYAYSKNTAKRTPGIIRKHS